MGRFGVIRLLLGNAPVTVPPQHDSEQSAAARAVRNQRVKAFETEAAQGCAATEDGAIRSDKGSGDPEVDEAASSAGNLGDRPLVVLTAGQYWRPKDPALAQEAAEFQETWVHQLQPELARLSTDGKQVMVENADHGIPEERQEPSRQPCVRSSCRYGRDRSNSGTWTTTSPFPTARVGRLWVLSLKGTATEPRNRGRILLGCLCRA